MSLHVQQPGMHTTLQDLGRWGYQRFGVCVGGGMDTCSLRLANLLLDNAADAAALEMTFVGPNLLFQHDALIAICGGEFAASLNSEPLPLARPVLIRSGSLLKLGAATTGRCGYLAIAGGFDVPLVMGSRSTYVRAGYGGHLGRCLQMGDQLSIGQPSATAQRALQRWRSTHELNPLPFIATRWHVAPHLPIPEPEMTIRVLLGSEFASLSPASQQHFLTAEFAVSSQADRMGFRLRGPSLTRQDSAELISTAVCRGTIQLPAAGQPILLMADCATTGGYLKIAEVASVDLSLVAQARPGTKLRFHPISLADAHILLGEYEQNLHELQCGLALHWKQESWLTESI